MVITEAGAFFDRRRIHCEMAVFQMVDLYFYIDNMSEKVDVPVDMNAVTYTDNTDQYTDFEEGGHYLD